MAELNLTSSFISALLGAAVPNEARQALLAASLGRPASARIDARIDGRIDGQPARDAVVIPLPPRPQAPVSVPERPFAA